MFKESVIGVIILQELGKHKWPKDNESKHTFQKGFILHTREKYTKAFASVLVDLYSR